MTHIYIYLICCTKNINVITRPHPSRAVTVSRLDAIGRKEGNVLFNDALNTFYLRLYGIIHMVTDHSDSEVGNPLLPHGLLFPSIDRHAARVLLYASSHRQDNTYHSLCYTSRGALAGCYCFFSMNVFVRTLCFFSPLHGWKRWPKPEIAPMTGMHYNSLL